MYIKFVLHNSRFQVLANLIRHEKHLVSILAAFVFVHGISIIDSFYGEAWMPKNRTPISMDRVLSFMFETFNI